MNEELKRDEKKMEEKIYNIYKTASGLYISHVLASKYQIGNKEEEKTIKEEPCYKVEDLELAEMEKKAQEEGTRLIPNIVTIFDLQLILSFTVYVDTNHNNKYYILDSLCKKYNIIPQSKRTLNMVTYGNVLEEDIEKIEEISKNEKIRLKRKCIETSLPDEVKPAEYLFVYYYDYNTNKYYVRRDTYDTLTKKGIKIEGTPKIINQKNGYSITEEELKMIEEKIGYRGVEQLVKPSIKKEVVAYKVTDKIMPYIDNLPSVTDKVMPYIDTVPSVTDKVMPYIDTAPSVVDKVMPYIDTAPSVVDKVMPYIDTAPSVVDKVMPYIDTAPSVVDKVMPYIDTVPSVVDQPIPNATSKIMPYISAGSIKHKKAIIYRDKRTGKLYVPENLMEAKATTKTILNRKCYEVDVTELTGIKEDFIVASIYPRETKEYNVIICNHNGRLFVSQKTIEDLGFYLEEPHKILVNKEIFVEITAEDIKWILERGTDELTINLIMKQIVRKRG